MKYITPGMKVADLLNEYPHLEDTLIQVAPVFSKLKNPVLRKTIAKVTSLEQAAAVGGIKVDYLINTLRKAAGQEESKIIEESTDIKIAPPAWLLKDKVVKVFDAIEAIRGGAHPLGDVMRDLTKLQSGEIYEFRTPFLPAPLLDKVKESGFHVWTEKKTEELYISYFCKI